MTDKETLKKMKARNEKRSFRFGDSVRYPSEYEIDIPLALGSDEATIKLLLLMQIYLFS